MTDHSGMSSTRVIAEARLGERNELTLPDATAKAAGITVGERLVVTFNPETSRHHPTRPYPRLACRVDGGHVR